MISEFFAENMLLMRIIYMMLFFLYAFAIALKINRSSELKLAKSLWLLAVYGALFGITELITIILLIKESGLSAEWVQILSSGDLFLKAVAYQVIFWLGFRLVADIYPQVRSLKRVILAVSGLWLLMIAFVWALGNQHLYLMMIDNLSRYMFSAPGLFFTGYGLIQHSKEVEKFNIPSLVNHIKGLAYTFFFGVFIIGMVPSHAILWPAAILNRETFEAFVGAPIVFFRSIYLIVMTYLVVKIVSVFEVEREHRLEKALKRQVLAEERDRIARELHDGIIQSIYGVGLKLKQFTILCRKKPEEADRQMEFVKKDLDKIIQDVRDYIEELHLDDYLSVSLKEALQQLIVEYRENAVMEVEFSVEGKQVGDLNIVQVNHILQIVRELLSNAAKHSRASTVTVRVSFREDNLVLRIFDDGVGFNPQTVKIDPQAGQNQGLDNIFHRVVMLQGTIVFHAAPGEGTRFEITLPYTKLSYLQSSFIRNAQYFGSEGEMKGEPV
ncbi:sensor histidine kinase [Dethiobacter alkaliphilus]|uniref:Oxygen sensor histidine kinase NreB n=1 Tax=Dethiobacter alkaliphilus AHT 1 TaxID=555088 RepID=C0GF27_DETAL|nr:sensor histidine kinase [Dethiobacter alkaliphilus]EEG78209.1 integral membrane sensor signal transduction histidine kinase [Dethiobacter alkaliphilus AHT 1]